MISFPFCFEEVLIGDIHFSLAWNCQGLKWPLNSESR